MTFSSLNELKCGFTRDYGAIKRQLLRIEDFDKTAIEVALHGASQLILNEWGNNIPCQVSSIFNYSRTSIARIIFDYRFDLPRFDCGYMKNLLSMFFRLF